LKQDYIKLILAMVDLNKPGSIERVIAITEIERILNKYCIMARENAPFSGMANLFHSNGNFRLPNGAGVPPQEMGTVVQGKPPAFIRHHLTSVDIEFTSETEAKTKSLFFAMTGTSTIDHWGVTGKMSSEELKMESGWSRFGKSWWKVRILMGGTRAHMASDDSWDL
jgi:hypothetical protein